MDNSEIASVTNPENGEVTLYLANAKGGPIVTGTSYTHAMSRWHEAFGLFQLASAFWAED